MQGGQGDIKHWAFNDPLRREASSPIHRLPRRNTASWPRASSSCTRSPSRKTPAPPAAATSPWCRSAPYRWAGRTWQSEKVSIWQAGTHDNPFGQRLTALMISKGIADSSVPMSLLADHPNVQFNYFRGGLGTCSVEMH